MIKVALYALLSGIGQASTAPESATIVYVDAPKELTTERRTELLKLAELPAAEGAPIEAWTTSDGKTTFLFPRELGGRRYYDLNTKILEAWFPRITGQNRVMLRNRELGGPENGIAAVYAPFGFEAYQESVGRLVDPDGLVELSTSNNLILTDGSKTIEARITLNPIPTPPPAAEDFKPVDQDDTGKALKDLGDRFSPTVSLRNISVVVLKGRVPSPALAESYASFMTWLSTDLAERRRQYESVYEKVLIRFKANDIAPGSRFEGLPTRQKESVLANANYLVETYGFASKDELTGFLERSKVVRLDRHLVMSVPMTVRGGIQTWMGRYLERHY